MPIIINATDFAEPIRRPPPGPPHDPHNVYLEQDMHMDRQAFGTQFGGRCYSSDITQTTTRELDPRGW